MSAGSAENRLIILNIGSKNGFLPGCFLMYRAGTTTGDYHGQMNSGNFEKWITVQVIPNMPPSSTVVMDNAPYHSRQEDKPPSKYEVKKEIIAWLQRRGIVCDDTMRKSTLNDLVESSRPKRIFIGLTSYWSDMATK
jgi:hypothetical protein